ncbi:MULTISPECIES: hypothetical protein [Pantoea]|uniref:Uncharacterized protein n=1 Tax=Candidatus Pantoea multigeneris TaxID=2608357 RepID=A0ABX0RK44_9GAMM|nr:MULTISPECIES: hypothetical protein [Pantoea]NIF23979.1 hypothetical protein [Pantoea multigeneris]
MPDNDHDQHHLIIGEAAVHLAVNNTDITVDSLIRELANMAASEKNPARCVQIRGAKRWLRGFKSLPGNRDELRWVTVSGRGSTH